MGVHTIICNFLFSIVNLVNIVTRKRMQERLYLL